MRLRHIALNLAAAVAFAAAAAHAQSAQPTASRLIELSAFGGLTGTYTGLSGGRNLGITAGVDVTLPPLFGWQPSIEGRGNHWIDAGKIVAEKSAMGGVRLERRLLVPGLRVYGDILFGRGEMDYQNGGYPAPGGNFLYLASNGPVVSPGAGAEYRLTESISALADVQFQHWDTPAKPSGSVWSTPITLGVRYRFNFNRHGYARAPK